ncbi:hypothetical protein Tamer19_29880 [Cupriavidus sp. TA19]|nr:hypothetical protein Tamer19_29880 [Cupriavidus sp. TA19]
MQECPLRSCGATFDSREYGIDLVELQEASMRTTPRRDTLSRQRGKRIDAQRTNPYQPVEQGADNDRTLAP